MSNMRARGVGWLHLAFLFEWLLRVCAKGHAAGNGTVRIDTATFSLHRTLQFGRKGAVNMLKYATISVLFNEPMANLGVLGTTRLVCPPVPGQYEETLIVDSHPHATKADGWPIYLIPATDGPRRVLKNETRAESPARTSGVASLLRPQRTRPDEYLATVLLLATERTLSPGSREEMIQLGRGGHLYTHTHLLNPRRLRTCHVRFLKPREQNYNSKRVCIRSMHGKTAFYGSTKMLQEHPRTTRANPFDEVSVAGDLLWNSTQKRMQRKGFVLNMYEHSVKDVRSTTMNCANAMLETAFQAEATNGIMNVLGMPELTDVILPKVKTFSSSFIVKFGGTVGDSGVDQLSAGTAANQIGTALTKTIGGELSRLVTPHLSETLVPPLLETIASSTTESVTEMVQKYMIRKLSPPLARALSVEINEGVVTGVPDRVVEKAPIITGRLLTRSLSHFLSRSLPHAIVPSLLHTITHNPMQDYYCYYCYHHKAYCQYCTYSPSQLYYAMYYTGFYSTYYTDYYSHAMLTQMSAESYVNNPESRLETLDYYRGGKLDFAPN